MKKILKSSYFFQAEDGIRDLTVTGVRRVLFRSQYYYDEEPAASQYDLEMSEFNTKYGKNKSKTTNEKIKLKEGTELKTKSKKGRSEERRVGKECRCRWSEDD